MSKETEFMKRLLATFKVEATEHGAAIASGLVEIEKCRVMQEGTTDAQLRNRVSGSPQPERGGRTVNSSTVEAVCQSMESIFSILKRKAVEPERSLFDLFHRALDLIHNLVGSSDMEVGPSDKALAQTLAFSWTGRPKNWRGNPGRFGTPRRAPGVHHVPRPGRWGKWAADDEPHRLINDQGRKDER